MVRLANLAIDDVRRRVQQDELGHRGRKGDPLYGIRRLLLAANERLSDHARFRLEAGLGAGDPRDEVLDTCWPRRPFATCMRPTPWQWRRGASTPS